MSDIPPTGAPPTKIESPSLKYAAQSTARKVVFAVDIPYPLIKLWKEFVEAEQKNVQTCSSEKKNALMWIYLSMLFLIMYLG
jgi:hypothetical protein